MRIASKKPERRRNGRRRKAKKGVGDGGKLGVQWIMVRHA